MPRLQAVLQREVGYIGLNTRNFLEITRGADVLLNPGSDYGRAFVATEIAGLLDGSFREPAESYVIRRGTEISIGRPGRYPRELVGALKRLFAKRKNVERAWLVHIYIPGCGEPGHTLIALEVTSDYQAVAADAGLVARAVAVPDPPVDFMQVSGEQGRDYVRAGKLFYRRRWLDLF